MIELPANFTGNIASSTTSFVGALSPVAVLIISVLLGAVVIEILIHAIRNK